MTALFGEVTVKGHWCKMPYAIINHPQLTPAAKLLYAAIAYRVGSNDCCWPGVRRLAMDTHLAVRTVSRTLVQLRDSDLLSIEKGTSGRTNRYRLTHALADKKSTSSPTNGQNVHGHVRKRASEAQLKRLQNKIKEVDTHGQARGT